MANGLVWNTNSFNTGGTISVVSLTSPIISAIQISGRNLLVTGGEGPDGLPYSLLATTNLAGSWTPSATNNLDVSGDFSLTLTHQFNSGQPQSFYKTQFQ